MKIISIIHITIITIIGNAIININQNKFNILSSNNNNNNEWKNVVIKKKFSSIEGKSTIAMKS